MKNDFLTIKQASTKYSVSASTITRFARKNEHTKFVSKENGKYLISDSLLKTSFEKAENHAPVETKTENSNEKVINFLQSQNEFLQSQIIEKDSQIQNLLQRQFEQNTIIQTLQNRFEGIGNKIDSSVLLLSEKVKENKEVAPEPEKQNDNGFTIASAVMILLLVLMIIVYLTVK
jgi:hypothetical protein